MTEKLFSFRWDIDHRACITDGLPKIINLCDQLQIANTFFVNMGKSTNLRQWLGKGLSSSRAKFTDTESINLIQKIGWGRFLYETALSRPVGLSLVPQLQELQSSGHELGLHGGSDHVVWSRKFGDLPEDVIRADVESTLATFTGLFGKPAGFTSPGFKSDDRIMRLVQDLGFQYNGDAIGGLPKRAELNGKSLAHWTIPVTICGPRTIPFIEWHSAKGSNDESIFQDFIDRIAGQQFVVLYGHPCYEGLRTNLLQRIFERVQKLGFQIVRHSDIADKLSSINQ